MTLCGVIGGNGCFGLWRTEYLLCCLDTMTTFFQLRSAMHCIRSLHDIQPGLPVESGSITREASLALQRRVVAEGTARSG